MNAAASTYGQKKRPTIKKVVIVYPYTYVNPHFCLPPLAAEYLQAGFLEAGVEAKLLDMRFEGDIRTELADADLICLYGFFEDCAIFGKWKIHVIDEVMQAIPPRTPILAGGTGFGKGVPTLEAYPRIDVVIEGMPDTPIQELMAAGDPDGIPNLTWRRGDEIVRNDRVTHRLSETVFPRRKLRNPRYEYHALGIPVDLIRAGMGCNYRCRFCYQYGKDTDGNYLRWQGRSAQSQFAELSEIAAPFVFWVDDDMTTDMEALEELSDLLIASDQRKYFVGTGRVDHVAKSRVEVLSKLERAGFVGLAYGVESLNEDTLRFYRKGQTPEMVEAAMRMMTQTNILLFCNFLLGSPGESEEEMLNYLWAGARWNVDTLVTNRLRVAEGTLLYRSIYDPETGEVRPGMERIRGRRLKRIKRSIKYGQRTPFRLGASILKLQRHRGLHYDPLYFICAAFETFARHTWAEYPVKAVVFVPKHVATWPAFRAVTRTTARFLTPPWTAITKVFETVDRQIGLSTTLIPAFMDLFSRTILEKQKHRAQHGEGRAIHETGRSAIPSVKVVGRS